MTYTNAHITIHSPYSIAGLQSSTIGTPLGKLLEVVQQHTATSSRTASLLVISESLTPEAPRDVLCQVVEMWFLIHNVNPGFINAIYSLFGGLPFQ